MTDFHFHAHTDIEKLAETFLQDRKAHPEHYRSDEGGIFPSENLLVPSAGMFQWLKQIRMDHGEALLGAKTKDIPQGIREILHRLCPAFTPELYTADVMKWGVFHLLHGLLESPPEEAPWAPLLDYLRSSEGTGEDQEVRLYSFAGRIALLFDQYQSYLPHTLSAWARGDSLTCALEKGKTSLDKKLQWQPLLWHKLHEHLGGSSLAEALDHVLSSEGKGSLPPVTVFGATMMPPPYLRLLKQYSQRGVVNFYYHGPCREFWGDNRPTKKVEEGFFQNSLLADNARQAQDFFNLLVEEGLLSAGEEEETGAPPQPASLLQALQEQVRNNTCPPKDNPFPETVDDSLTFHLCHSPRRQVEVLRDLLLYLLKTHNTARKSVLTLNDILVMAPDITLFAPAIKAVFDASPLKGRYAVTDRTLRQTNLLAETFLKILQLPESGFAFSWIDALLDSQPLCQRFAFSPEAITDIRQWIREGRAHLGYDAKSRKEDFAHRGIEGVTEEQEEFTWRKALDRMLLAEVMELPADEQEQHPAFGNLLPLPVASTEGNSRQTLGNLSRLLRELQETSQALQDEPQGRTLSEWHQLLQAILERFFLEDTQNTADFSALRKQFQRLEENGKLAKADGLLLPRSLMTKILQGLLEAATTSGGSPSFLAGKITCCSLMPMRGIPCKIIALLGMDQGAFPRQDPHQDFSLLNDDKLLPYFVRSKAAEDRYIFLETLLAAREKLLLFYQGFQADGKEQPPAIVVRQLRDYVKPHTPQSLDVIHPLNNFDIRNFQGNPSSLLSFFSFDAPSARTGTPPAPASPKEPPPAPDALPSSLVLTLRELEALLENGVEAFRQHALGCRQEEDDLLPEDQEPLESGPLEMSNCRKFLARRLRPLRDTERTDEATWGDIEKELRARDLLPFGPLGEKAFLKYKALDGKALEEQGYWEAEEHSLELPLEIPGNGESSCRVSLRGTCLVAKEKLLHVCYGEKNSNKHRLLAYLERLLWEATQGDSIPAIAFSFADPQKTVEIPAPPPGETAQALLQKLVGFHCRSWQEPLPVTLELLEKANNPKTRVYDFSKLEPEQCFPEHDQEKLLALLKELASFLPKQFPWEGKDEK